MLELAEPGATFLLNSPYGPDEVWDKLPVEVQKQIIDKKLRFYVVDAYRVAERGRAGRRINTVMQTCFFALANVLPARRGDRRRSRRRSRRPTASAARRCCERNFAAVDGALAALHEVEGPGGDRRRPARGCRRCPAHAPDFVQRVTAMMIAGKGDLLPVSALPVDGTFPTGTAQYEKRSIAQEIPIWDPTICIQCGLCALVCPHAAIRMKVFDAGAARGQAGRLPVAAVDAARNCPGQHMTIQVAPDDCTGCGVCVDVCPAISKEVVKHKAINMEPKLDAPRARAGQLRLLPRASPTSTARRSRPTRSRARSCCSRSSSSPAPAPAAARRPTSS